MKKLVTGLTLLALAACQTQDLAKTNTPSTDAASSAPTASLAGYQNSLTAEQLGERCEIALASARADFQQFEALPPPYTIDSLLKPVDRLFAAISNNTGMPYLLNNVHPNGELQASADTCVQEFTKLATDIGLSKPLYQRLQQVDVSEARADTRRYHRELLRGFQRSGVDKNDQQREKIRELNEKITALGQTFYKNSRSDVRSISVGSAKLLEGLPQDYIDQHKASDTGSYTITTDYPDFLPFMRYVKDDDTRLSLYKQFLNRGYPQNKQVLKDIIVSRYQLANTLGYADYAEYATEELMSKNPTVVRDFINRIDRMAKPRADEDYQQLLATLQTFSPQATSVGNWQKSYLEEIVKQQQYKVDTKAVREYFHYPKVRDGIFALIEDLFGVSIEPWQTDTWNDDVEAWQVIENGETIGQFYLDMHPRADKYKHAAQFTVQSGILGEQLPVAALVCNFPTGLMEHSQVETFLHEFGHLIHTIFGGKQRWSAFAGVATERDFVEAPSQMLEEWIWDYDTLKAFAINEQGEVIPEALVEKMRNARDFARGTFIRNQMFYAAMSLNYYQTPPEALDLDKIMIEMQTNYSPFAYIDDTHFYASFGHLFGYSAAYYTYMWSEVIAADILKEFKDKGMRNTELARHYRQTVLAPGGSKDAAELVEDFLGRPFNFDAFIEKLSK